MSTEKEPQPTSSLLSRWLIPAGLAVLAFLLNFAALSDRAQTASVVTVKDRVRAGDELLEENLTRMEVHGDPSKVAEVYIPYASRAILFGRPAPRELAPKDPILWRDQGEARWEWPINAQEEVAFLPLDRVTAPLAQIQIGDQISFVVTTQGNPVAAQRIGPFRVLSVGSQALARARSDSLGSAFSERVVAVAVKKGQDAKELDEKLVGLLKARTQETGGPERTITLTLDPGPRGRPAKEAPK